VVSNLRGRFKLHNGLASFSQLSFQVPGALISLNGRYDLRSEKIDMQGLFRMQATLSDTQSGVKHWLLKPFDPLFKKNGAGFQVPLEIKGTKDHPEVGNALTLVGETYLAEGKLEEAQPRLERAVAVLSKADANYQRNLALALNSLGTLRAHQNRFAEATEAFRRALDINMKVAPQDPAVAQGLNNLATVEARAGRFADAERDYKKALEIQERAGGPNHGSVGNTLFSLGGVYSSQGRHAEAAEAYKRSLAIMEKALGPDHPVVASILEGYASALDALKKKPEADAMRKRAKAIQDKRR